MSYPLHKACGIGCGLGHIGIAGNTVIAKLASCIFIIGT